MSTSVPQGQMTDLRLDGRVALITGGAGGIGIAVAKRLAEAGARIALTDINSAALDRAIAQANFAQRPHVVTADISRSDQVISLVENTLSALGQIDILINNAGVMGRTAPLWELTDEDWNRVLDVDLASVFRVTRAVISQMRARRTGSIVSIASIAGKEGTPQLIPYSVAKAGIIAFTKALGKEVVGDGIRVNCIAPGVIQTPLLDQLPPEVTKIMLSKIPMGRFGTVEEIASIVHFLAADAASFITAQCFDASGGRATY